MIRLIHTVKFRKTNQSNCQIFNWDTYWVIEWIKKSVQLHILYWSDDAGIIKIVVNDSTYISTLRTYIFVVACIPFILYIVSKRCVYLYPNVLLGRCSQTFSAQNNMVNGGGRACPIAPLPSMATQFYSLQINSSTLQLF